MNDLGSNGFESQFDADQDRWGRVVRTALDCRQATWEPFRWGPCRPRLRIENLRNLRDWLITERQTQEQFAAVLAKDHLGRLAMIASRWVPEPEDNDPFSGWCVVSSSVNNLAASLLDRDKSSAGPPLWALPSLSTLGVAGMLLAQQPELDPQLLDSWVQSHLIELREAAAGSPRITRTLWLQLAEGPANSVVLIALNNPRARPDDLAQQYERWVHNDFMRDTIIGNPSCPLELLVQAATDQRHPCRRTALENPSLPEEYRVLGEIVQ